MPAYFSSAFYEFFKGLAANNHKGWFDANRKTYQSEVKKPFDQLVLDFQDELAKLDPDFQPLKPGQYTFRINRDVRFSNDKTPYKTHVAAYMAPGGKKGSTGLYFQLSPEYVALGGGVYEASTAQVTAVREAIAADPSAFRKLIDAKAFRAKFPEVLGERNKVLPKEFKAAAEQEPLLYQKQWYVWREDTPELATSPELLAELVAYYRLLLPFNLFFRPLVHP